MLIQNLSLKVKLGAIFFTSFLLNLIAFFIMFQFINDHRYDAHFINIAGSQRMLTQQLVYETHLFADGNTIYKSKLQQTATKFADNHKKLLHGNNRLGIPNATDPSLKDQIMISYKQWEFFQVKLNSLLNEKDPEKLHLIAMEIQKKSNTLLLSVDNLTKQIEKKAEQNVQTIKYIQIGILLLNLCIFLFAMWASINHIINPITKVIERMQRVSHGDIHVNKLDISRTDEVGYLSDCFNSMVSNLKHLVLTGKVQSNFLPPEITNEFFDIKTIYKPSEYVSGDFFHYIWDKESNQLNGYLIDVMGHGLGTALQTAHLHVLFEQAANKHDWSLVEKVEWVNKEAQKFFAGETFAAGIYFEYNFNTKVLKYVSCGINYFIAYTREHKGLVTVEGGLIGVLETMPFEEQQMSFSSGDYFYILTDGILDILDTNRINSFSNFIFAYEMLQKTINSNLPKDDASAVCIYIK